MSGESTVLVIDDLPQNTRLLEAILTPRGYRVVTAGSGEDGLKLLREEKPDPFGDRETELLVPVDGHDRLLVPRADREPRRVGPGAHLARLSRGCMASVCSCSSGRASDYAHRRVTSRGEQREHES
jgi:hypothetical protein